MNASQRIWEIASTHSDASLLASVQQVIHETREPLAVWTAITSDIEPFVERIVDGGGVARSLGSSTVIRVQDKRGEFAVLLAPVAASTTDAAGVWHIMSFLPTTDPRWNVPRAAAAYARPRVSSVLLNEADFLSIGQRLADHGEVTVSRMTARKLSDGSSLNRGWPHDYFHPSPSPRDVVEEAADASIRTLTLTVEGVLRLHLRRESGATFYSGDFGVFETVVLTALARAAHERLALLSGREQHVGAVTRGPVGIRFESGRLSGQGVIGSLADAIQREKPFGVAVFHGNPYVHLVVTDYQDGSSFSVFVADDDEVRVVPGFHATVGSLARLTDAIGERLGAESILEARATPAATLDDLFVSS